MQTAFSLYPSLLSSVASFKDDSEALAKALSASPDNLDPNIT